MPQTSSFTGCCGANIISGMSSWDHSPEGDAEFKKSLKDATGRNQNSFAIINTKQQADTIPVMKELGFVLLCKFEGSYGSPLELWGFTKNKFTLADAVRVLKSRTTKTLKAKVTSLGRAIARRKRP